MEIPQRVAEIRRRIDDACRRAERPPGSVRLVAVSKTRSVAEIQAAARAGVIDFGENRVQEAEEKHASMGSQAGPPLRWHLVGHLQKNKVRKAVPIFDWIQSVDGIELAGRIDGVAGELSKVQPVLVQVDLAGETTKSGVPESHLDALLESLRELSRLRIEGLMVLPPLFPDPERARPFFRRLRELSERARGRGLAGSELSMGMSHDFEVAIEEGATMVRIGTALFGARPSPNEQRSNG